MKNLSAADAPAFAPPAGPARRYTLRLPEEIEILLGEVEIPASRRSDTFNPRRQIKLPCRDILRGPLPSVSGSLLLRLCASDLAPGLHPEERWPVKASALALAYHPVEIREPGESPRTPQEPPPAKAAAPDQKIAKKEAPSKFAQPKDAPASAKEMDSPPSVEKSEEDAKKTESSLTEPSRDKPEQPSHPRKIFGMLPIFRRKTPAQPQEEPQAVPEPSPSVAPITPEAPLATKAPEPKPSDAPPASPAPANAAPEPKTPPTPAPDATPPPAPAQDAMPPSLPNEEKLRELFLVEESLTVGKVLSLCQALPGVTACLFCKGGQRNASEKIPAEFDLDALAAHATEAVETQRAVASKMGLAPVCAVTVHAERGPVSFFHNDGLSLIVFHADRGFVPGVRERLAETVRLLSQGDLPATPPLP